MNKLDEIKVHHDNILCPSIIGEALKPFCTNDLIIICIGTDKCIGDCLGPLVGTLLKKENLPFKVYGTLEEPIHALNIKKRTKQIKLKHPMNYTIAIDACLGERDSVGHIQIRKGPIFPGKGVGKKLPSIGDLSIIGIVDTVNDDFNLSLHAIRLGFIMKMAESIVEAFKYAYNNI
ncbi:MAG: spore protease YyaC [Firmicutes bacterium]|nr:spore protease YyaC [Bacillota bacterium]